MFFGLFLFCCGFWCLVWVTALLFSVAGVYFGFVLFCLGLSGGLGLVMLGVWYGCWFGVLYLIWGLGMGLFHVVW